MSSPFCRRVPLATIRAEVAVPTCLKFRRLGEAALTRFPGKEMQPPSNLEGIRRVISHLLTMVYYRQLRILTPPPKIKKELRSLYNIHYLFFLIKQRVNKKKRPPKKTIFCKSSTLPSLLVMIKSKCLRRLLLTLVKLRVKRQAI